MPVATLHHEYAEQLPRIELTEAAVEGEVRDEALIPRLSGQSKAAWQAYVNRAAYYNVTDRSLLALVGALTRRPATINGLVGDAPNVDEGTFSEFLARTYRTLLTQARVGLHVDWDDQAGTPKLIAYEAEDIINWTDRFVVIKECVEEADPDDEFVINHVPQWRELRLNEAGQYEVRLWREKGKDRYVIVDVITPLSRGAPLDYIPFWFVTPYDTSDEIYSPPLYPLAELNVQHFKVAVDHGHGLHFLALPQPYLAGDVYTADGRAPQTLAIGTDQVWHITPGSNVGYLEFSGQGMGALADQLTRLEDQMYAAGARLLTTKGGVESAEALRLRSGSETATLTTMAGALEEGLTQALTAYNAWAGAPTVPEVKLNHEFSAVALAPDDIKALLELYAAGTITLDTLLRRLYEGDLVPDVAAEAAALAATPRPMQTPAATAMPSPMQPVPAPQ